MVWRPEDPQGFESRKIAHLIVPYTRGRGLDVGCGLERAYPHMIGVDNGNHWGERSAAQIHSEADDLGLFADRSMDFVFSSHTLEHMADPLKTLREWWRVIRPGGHLVLYLPHRDLYPRIGQPGANPDHKHDFHPDDIVGLMRSVAGGADGWTLRENETRSGGREYSFFQVFQKRSDGRMVEDPWQRNPGGKKRCIVARYGTYGDHMIASSVLPHLKQQGYFLTYNTVPKGEEVLRHDPHIDEFLIQDPDQVPNSVLGAYFRRLEERYDRIVNLCETVEGSLLQLAGRVGHTLPPDARHRIFNKNYHEHTHDVAGVPHVFRCRFYPSPEEQSIAERVRAKARPRAIVMVALSGSAIHKTYPHLHAVMSWLLLHTDTLVITVGDRRDQMLEVMVAQMLLADERTLGDKALPVEKTEGMKMGQLIRLVDEHYGRDRWRPRAGAWSMRESMVMAQHSDVVVGPETAILNAVSMEPGVAKVIMLSHSSHENLTKHWVNTTVLQAPDGTCPNAVVACHQLHFGSETCPQHEQGGALCAHAITPQSVFDSIIKHLRAKFAA